MSVAVNRRVFLKHRPAGLPRPSDFEWREDAVPTPAEGQFLVRNRYLSLDPAIRGWMDASETNYLPPIPLDSVMWGLTVGEVMESRCASFKPGDRVRLLGCWQDYAIGEDNGYTYKLSDEEREEPQSLYLGVLGLTGLTAYFGLLDVGQPRAGETVLVSGAAGAVGSVVGQIAKLKGCHVVGLAGSDEKCRWLTTELGFDAAINYKTAGKLEDAIRAACPKGVDVYFDNVGGPTLDAVLLNIAEHARLIMCGSISTYNAKEPQPGPYNLWQLLVKSARLEGFLLSSYHARFLEGTLELTKWIKAGRIKYREDVIDGLENVIPGFLKLFDGSNRGKLVCRI